MSHPRRSSRVALTAAAVVAGTVLAAVPAQAQWTWRVNCNAPVTLDMDGASYELYGTCGTVRITADDARVTMPAVRRLVIEGARNAVTAKPVSTLTVTGEANHVVTPTIVWAALAGAGSTADVAGLVDDADLSAAATLHAGRVHELTVTGDGAVVGVDRGFVARVHADDARLSLRKLDKVLVEGTGNRVRVAEGSTRVRDRGEGNRIRVARRR